MVPFLFSLTILLLTLPCYSQVAIVGAKPELIGESSCIHKMKLSVYNGSEEVFTSCFGVVVMIDKATGDTLYYDNFQLSKKIRPEATAEVSLKLNEVVCSSFFREDQSMIFVGFDKIVWFSDGSKKKKQ